MDAFWAAPPVTRTLTASAVVVSLAAWSGIVSPYYVVFLRQKLFKIGVLPQIWRLVTPFLLTSPKFGILLDPYFLWTYGSALETGSSRFASPGDFFVFLAFVGIVILVSGLCLCSASPLHVLCL